MDAILSDTSLRLACVSEVSGVAGGLSSRTALRLVTREASGSEYELMRNRGC